MKNRNEIKSDLIKIAAEILVRCPLSTDLEDFWLVNIQKKNSAKIQYKLDEFEKWKTEVAIKIRDLSREIIL